MVLLEAGPNAVLAFAREGYKKGNVNLKDVSDYSYILDFGGWLGNIGGSR